MMVEYVYRNGCRRLRPVSGLTSLMLCLMTFFDEFRYVVVKPTVKVTDRRTGQRLLTVEPSELIV